MAKSQQTVVQTAPIRIPNHNITVVQPAPIRIANHNLTLVRR